MTSTGCTMAWNPEIYSFNAVQEYRTAKRLYPRLALLGAVYVLIDFAIFKLYPGLAVVVAVVMGAAVFALMALRAVADVNHARARLEAEKRQWIVKQAHRA
jgi:hypothetical protein